MRNCSGGRNQAGERQARECLRLREFESDRCTSRPKRASSLIAKTRANLYATPASSAASAAARRASMVSSAFAAAFSADASARALRHAAS